MSVTTPREAWTDPRIDDLSEKVDTGFEKADKKMEAGFDRLDKKFDRLIFTLLATVAGAILTHYL